MNKMSFTTKELTTIKKDFFLWVAENFMYRPTRRDLKHVSNAISHENLHVLIYNKFIENAEVTLVMGYAIKHSDFKYRATVSARYPEKYSDIKFYPRTVFVDLIQTIYDVLDRIFTMRFNLIPIVIKKFIKALLDFKGKKIQ